MSQQGLAMATLNLQCAQSEDDAREKWTFSAGQMELVNASYISMGNVGFFYHAGYRFPSVSGLSGSTITTAIMTFRADATDTGTFVGTMYAHDVAAPGVFTSTLYNITDTGQRPRTTASVACGSAELGNWTAGQDYTLDVKTIVQELADSHDPGAIVMLFIFSSGTGERLAESWDDVSANAAKLAITYTAAAGDAELTAVVTTAAALSPVSVWTADATLSAQVTTAYAESPAAEITGTEAGTIVAVVAMADALSPASTWTADATLSAVVTTAYAISPVASFLTDGAPTFPDTLGNEVIQINRTEYPTTALFYLEVNMLTFNAAQSARAKLYNITDTADVTGSDVSTTSTTADRARSGAFGIASGTNEYRVDVGGDAGGQYQFFGAKLLVDW